MDERARGHRSLRTHCLIPGCPLSPGFSIQPDKHKWLCDGHWKLLPMPLKRRWWDETQLSKRAPSAELQQLVIEALSGESK